MLHLASGHMCTLSVMELFDICASLFVLKVESVLIAGGGRKDNYLSEMISHVIADDGAEDEVTEAKELFRLPVVMV